jgi:hypothetical protein
MLHRGFGVEDHLDDRQAALEQLEREDGMGPAMFGDSDEWIDKRLTDGTRND